MLEFYTAQPILKRKTLKFTSGLYQLVVSAESQSTFYPLSGGAHKELTLEHLQRENIKGRDLKTLFFKNSFEKHYAFFSLNYF